LFSTITGAFTDIAKERKDGNAPERGCHIKVRNVLRPPLTLTEKHSERGNVAKISRNEKRVRMKAQMPGPPGSAVSETRPTSIH